MSFNRVPFSGFIFAVALSLAAPIALAQETEPNGNSAPEAEPETEPSADEVPETVIAATGLLEIITAIDEDARLTGNGATFSIDDTAVTLVFDVNADRMRLFSQIAPSDGLSGAQLRRLMQANFDTALDARYAVAQGQLWSTFMHRMTTLSQEDFVSALAQTVTLVKTYGTTFSSGAMSFGGGDSNAEIQKLLDRILRDDGEDI
ncbi:MAG: hypothetical protein ACE37M_08350 [Henriciella sp.]